MAKNFKSSMHKDSDAIELVVMEIRFMRSLYWGRWLSRIMAGSGGKIENTHDERDVGRKMSMSSS
jgi:hypothetical protein